EGTLGSGWTQTAPPQGSNADYSVDANHVVTLAKPITDLLEIDFGNFNLACATLESCEESPGLDVSKTATNTTTWKITKDVDHSEIDIAAGGSATFNYTVGVKYTLSSVVSGTITLSNNSPADITLDPNSGLTDVLSAGGACSF